MMLAVSSYYFVQDIKRFYMSMTKVIINNLGCFSSQQSYETSVLSYCLTKIRNTISLAVTLTIIFVYTFSF